MAPNGMTMYIVSNPPIPLQFSLLISSFCMPAHPSYPFLLLLYSLHHITPIWPLLPPHFVPLVLLSPIPSSPIMYTFLGLNSLCSPVTTCIAKINYVKHTQDILSSTPLPIPFSPNPAPAPAPAPDSPNPKFTPESRSDTTPTPLYMNIDRDMGKCYGSVE